MATDFSDAPEDTEIEETELPGEVSDPERVLDATQGPPRVHDQPRPSGRRRGSTSRGAPVHQEYPPDHPTHVQSKDIVDKWPAVLAYVSKNYGLGPEGVRINVGAVALGPYAGNAPSASMGSIPGECVAGDENRSPADALRDWVIDAFHAFQRGPVQYRFRFFFKTIPPGLNHSQICEGELSLASPEMVAAQRRAVAMAFERSQRQGGTQMPAAGLGALPQAPGAPPMHLLPPAPVAASGGLNEDIVQEIMRRLLAGQPLGAVAPVPPPPPPVTEDQMIDRLIKLKKLFDQPAPLPPPPPPPPPKVPTVEEQFENVARIIKAAQSMMPQQSAAIVPASSKPASPMDAVKDVLTYIKQFDEVKGALGIGGDEPDGKPEEDDTPDPFKVFNVPGSDVKWPHGDNLSTAEQAKQFLALNPDLSFKMLGKVAEIVDHTTIGQFFKHLMERSTPQQAAVVAQVAQAKGIGVGTPPAPVNGAAQHPPTIPTPPPAAEWKPPV